MDDHKISDEFVKRHYPGLCAMLTRRIKDAALAAEMLHEAVITAIKHTDAGRVAEPAKLAGYVYRVALNLYRNHRRSHDNRTDLRSDADEIQALADQGHSVEHSIDSGILRKVCAIIAELPTARDREIVKRFYLDE